MIHGFDTSFLVAAEVATHPEHDGARARLNALRNAGDQFALAPLVLSEFIHVVTDAKRFTVPLTIEAALARSREWWESPEIIQVLPDDETINLFFEWMSLHHLGRKRILDTMLAASYFSAQVASILTSNARDFTIFGVFVIVLPIDGNGA